MITHGSLFAGIGGFDLGFERAGIRTVWQVEIDEYCRSVLAKHFPSAARFSDIRHCSQHNLPTVDVISGGFPCQDISIAGKNAGFDGERTSLWREYARIIGELRPRYIVVENVATLLDRGMGRVLGDLAAFGYDAEWECLPAAAFGAPHLRERIYIVAYPGGQRLQGILQTWTAEMAARRSHREHAGMDTLPMLRGLLLHTPYASCLRLQVPTDRGVVERPLHGEGWWETGPSIYRMAHGVPRRMDRLKSIGNAVVPQIAEWIARVIVNQISSQRIG